MSDVRDLIRVAETHPPAPSDLPDVPLYIDDERPEVHSGSISQPAWRIPDEGAAEWAMRKKWEADDEIARITREHAEERARLTARIAIIDARIQEITSGQRKRSAFMEAVLLEWMSRCRNAIVKGKAKSRKLLYGTIGWRSAPEVLDYDDEKAAIAWAREQGIESGLYRVDFKLEKDAVKRFAKANGVVPPGARWRGGDDTPYVKVEAPAVPAAPAQVSPPLQLVKEQTP